MQMIQKHPEPLLIRMMGFFNFGCSFSDIASFVNKIMTYETNHRIYDMMG